MFFVPSKITNDNCSDVLYTRVRIYMESIYKNNKIASDIEKLSSNINGVKYSKANPLTGSLLIIYDDALTNELIIKRHIYRFVSKRFLYNKITDYEDIKSLSTNKSILLNSSKGNYHNQEITFKSVEENTFDKTSANSFNKSAYMSNKLSVENSNKPIHTRNDAPIENFINNGDIKSGFNYHALKINEVENLLKTNISKGLSKIRVDDKLKETGLNVISEVKRKSIIRRFFENLTEFNTKLLVGVGVLSTALGHLIDGIAILGIAAFETILSTLQQHKAEKSLNSLNKMMVPNATVIRDGKKRVIDAKYLVPGDIIIVEAGEKIPADARLIECYDLKTSEAMLTGESAAVCKTLDICNNKTELANRFNMIYMGTNILSGRGKAIVVSTGKNTEIGKIASMLQNIKTECAPIQNKINKFTTKITKISLLVSLGLCAVVLLRGASLVSVFLLGISFAIGAIPESLPALVTEAMALSVQKMAAKNAIVRNLTAVETLGSANVICCDKTGTLTMNEMTVKEIYVDNNTYKLTGSGYNPKGEIVLASGDTNKKTALDKIITASILCNNSSIIDCEGKWTVHGDPTEGALLSAAYKNNMNPEKLLNQFKRIREIPFDSSRRYMTVLVTDNNEKYAYCKGSLSKIMDKCRSIYEDGKERLFTSTDKKNLQAAADKMGENALRVLAFCYKKLSKDSTNIDNNYIFLGLVGMEDPPREEVKESIHKCHTAGIKVVMITGDNKNTAAAIGREIGLLTDGIVLSGNELDSMSDDELSHIINKVQVFARTSPEQKYKIVKAFRRAGNVVAMTGDGVNDAPAIKEADIGIAMGANGSDVARDTADIILTDDNFATIVAAIEEGRAVNRNIKNSLKYLLSGCLSEMLAICAATAVMGISPLTSMQILWINVVAETILGSALTLEAPDDNIMNYSPNSKNDEILDSKLKSQVIRRGVVTGLTTYGLFQGTLLLGGSLVKAQTLAFTNIILSQIVNIYDCKTNKRKSNKYMNIASIACLLMLGGIIYIPTIGAYFSTTTLLMKDLLLLAGTTTLSKI